MVYWGFFPSTVYIYIYIYTCWEITVASGSWGATFFWNRPKMYLKSKYKKSIRYKNFYCVEVTSKKFSTLLKWQCWNNVKKICFLGVIFRPLPQDFSGGLFKFAKNTQKMIWQVSRVIETCLKIFFSVYMIYIQQAHILKISLKKKWPKKPFFLLNVPYARI